MKKSASLMIITVSTGKMLVSSSTLEWFQHIIFPLYKSSSTYNLLNLFQIYHLILEIRNINKTYFRMLIRIHDLVFIAQTLWSVKLRWLRSVSY